jgi:hypothetical protein
MIATIKNLWSLTKSFPALLSFLVTIGKLAPAIMGLVKEIVKVLGSEEAIKLLDSVKEAVHTESPNDIPDIPQTEKQRRRILDRTRQRLGLSWLGINRREYSQLCEVKGVSCDMEEV